MENLDAQLRTMAASRLVACSREDAGTSTPPASPRPLAVKVGRSIGRNLNELARHDSAVAADATETRGVAPRAVASTPLLPSRMEPMKSWSELQKTHRDRCDEIRAEVRLCTEAFDAFADALRTFLVESAGCPSKRVEMKFAPTSQSEQQRHLFIDVEVISGKPFGVDLALLLDEDGLKYSLNPGSKDSASSPADVAAVAARIMDQFDAKLRALTSRAADGLPRKLHA